MVRARDVLLLVVVAAVTTVWYVESKEGGLQIGVKKRPEVCEMRTKKGDKLSMHYTVSQLYHCLKVHLTYTELHDVII